MTSSETTNELAMAPAIAAAIVKVIGAVKRLQRTEENKFQKYAYTSIDGFLEVTGPLCAAAGLFILSEETEKEISQAPKADREGTTNFLTIRWAFTLCHSSGAIYGPLHRTVTVPAAGAQAFGSSQSYALKQFMRGLFQIPTGDNDDPDKDQKHELPESTRQSPKKAETKSEPEKQSDPDIMSKALTMVSASPDDAMDEKISLGIKNRHKQGFLTDKDAATLQALLLKRQTLRNAEPAPKTPVEQVQWAIDQCETDDECCELAYLIEQREKAKELARGEAATLQDTLVKRQAQLNKPQPVGA